LSEQKTAQIINLEDVAKAKWEEDFKKRWRSSGNYTGNIWDWEEWLKSEGWDVTLYDKVLPEFHTYVDFDNKVLRNNNVKAYHAHYALKAIVERIFAGTTGRVLFYWEEVHDEAHRHVRDGDEWKDDPDYYMSVWYSREMYFRELNADEQPPVAEYPDAIIHPDEVK
jgi:hypothetical protein